MVLFVENNPGVLFLDILLPGGAVARLWDGSQWDPVVVNSWDGSQWRKVKFWDGTDWIDQA